ncbi:MAG TPA: N-6 DNA methylase [Candidatus Obscuribacterales bacterium]
MADRYPFYAYFDPAFEERLSKMVFEQLDADFQPRLQTAGDLYMQTLAVPLTFDADGEPVVTRRATGRLRRAGQFYTPDGVVDYCLSLTCTGGRKPAILDPACGTGNFLVGALSMSSDRLAQFEHLYGWDIDQTAISIARVLLLIACSSELRIKAEELGEQEFARELARLSNILEANVCVADATICAQAGFRPPVPTQIPSSFDLVVSNPPYVSFGSRNQSPMAPSHDRYLRAAFPSSSQYKIRMHSVFQEIALRLAAPGADAVLLVPDAFLTGAYYERLRKLIAEQADIISLTELPESTFPDATAGRWCVAHYRKKEAGSRRPLPANEVLVRKVDEEGRSTDFAMPAIRLISADKHRFRLLFNDLDLKLIELLDKLPTANTLVRGHTGIRARNGQSTIVADNCVGDKWKRGLVSGGQVTAHSIQWRGHWLNIEPQLLFAGGFNQEVISNPKVLVRQTADQLIGAVDADGFYHLNNVHSFAPHSKSILDAAFFAALINSRFWLYLYRLKSREEKRALAQIDIEMVEAMPLPKPNQRLQRIVGESVLSYLRCDDNRDRVMTAIDCVIYGMYQLEEQLIEHVHRQVARDASRKGFTSGKQALNLLESICNAKV